MQHLAIMRTSWGLTEKILSGEKHIESRWYSVRYRPWNVIKAGETVYFKNSGEPVKLRAKVSKVLQFSDLNPQKVRQLLVMYGKSDGIKSADIPVFYKRFKDKKYCMLIFLEQVKAISPFDIDKKGFGAMSAWITVSDIGVLKKSKTPIAEGF